MDAAAPAGAGEANWELLAALPGRLAFGVMYPVVPLTWFVSPPANFCHASGMEFA